MYSAFIYRGPSTTFLNCRNLALHRINTSGDKTPIYFLLLVHDSGWTKLFHLSHSIFPAFKAALWKKSIFWWGLGCGLSRQQWKGNPQWGTAGSTDGMRSLTAWGSAWYRPCQQARFSFLLGTLLKHFGFNNTSFPSTVPSLWNRICGSPVASWLQGVHPPTASRPPLRRQAAGDNCSQLPSYCSLNLVLPCNLFTLTFKPTRIMCPDRTVWQTWICLVWAFQGNGMNSCVKQGLQQPQPAGTAKSAKWCEDIIVIIIALLNLFWTKVFCYTFDPCTFIHLVLTPQMFSGGLFVAAVSLMCTSGGWASGCCSAWQSLNASMLLNTWYIL